MMILSDRFLPTIILPTIFTDNLPTIFTDNFSDDFTDDFVTDNHTDKWRVCFAHLLFFGNAWYVTGTQKNACLSCVWPCSVILEEDEETDTKCFLRKVFFASRKDLLAGAVHEVPPRGFGWSGVSDFVYWDDFFFYQTRRLFP